MFKKRKLKKFSSYYVLITYAYRTNMMSIIRNVQIPPDGAFFSLSI
jgi:hypothetical protein